MTSTAVPVYLERAWSALAPKLVAFLASGLTTSSLIIAAQFFGLTISTELALIVVGSVSTVASYIQSDPSLSGLRPGQFSLKVVTFMVTSATGVGVVAFLSELGLDLSAHAGLIGVILTLVATILGYMKMDAYPNTRVAGSPWSR